MCQHLEDAGESSAWLQPTGDLGDETWQEEFWMHVRGGCALVGRCRQLAEGHRSRLLALWALGSLRLTVLWRLGLVQSYAGDDIVRSLVCACMAPRGEQKAWGLGHDPTNAALNSSNGGRGKCNPPVVVV